MKYKGIYYGMLAGLALIWIASLGNGWRGVQADYTNWNYRAFYGICHADPQRSFHINDVPMAVNSRCFGVFSGLLITWFFIPLLTKITAKKNWPAQLLGVAALLQIIDVMGNILHLWINTLESRFILGALLGIAVVLALSDQFYQTKNK
jgi:uncharacterized membrane protein